MIAIYELPAHLYTLDNAAADAWFAQRARSLSVELWEAVRAGMAAATQSELDEHTLVMWELVERREALARAQTAFFKERKQQSAVRSVSHYAVGPSRPSRDSLPEPPRPRHFRGREPVHETRDEQLLADALRSRGGCVEARSGHVPRVRERG